MRESKWAPPLWLSVSIADTANQIQHSFPRTAVRSQHLSPYHDSRTYHCSVEAGTWVETHAHSLTANNTVVSMQKPLVQISLRPLFKIDWLLKELTSICLTPKQHTKHVCLTHVKVRANGTMYLRKDLWLWFKLMLGSSLNATLSTNLSLMCGPMFWFT